MSTALRILFQRALIETEATVVKAVVGVWEAILQAAELGQLLFAACPLLSGWLCLAMHPAKLSIDPGQMQIWLDTNSSTGKVIRSRWNPSPSLKWWLSSSIFCCHFKIRSHELGSLGELIWTRFAESRNIHCRQGIPRGILQNSKTTRSSSAGHSVSDDWNSVVFRDETRASD